MRDTRIPRRLRRNKELRKSVREANATIASLSAEEHTVRERISELERYIIEAPERSARARMRELEEMRTLPPPDELAAEQHFLNVTVDDGSARLMRSHEAALRRERRRNLLVFLAVSLLFASFALWLSETL